MTLKTRIAADVLNTFLNSDEFADDGTYTPYGGEAQSITGVFTEELSETRDGPDGPYDVRTGRLFISTDATSGIASPAKGDTWTLNGETWTVDEVELQAGSAAELTLILPTRRNVAAEGAQQPIARR